MTEAKDKAKEAKANATASATAQAKGRGEGGVRVATAEFAAGAARRDQVPSADKFEGAPEIAFAGRSNVGKSSLLNMMLSRRGLARTSNTPGCTRQINFFDVGLAGDTTPKHVVFVDLPGYGYAKVSKSEGKAWKELLEGYLRERSSLRAVVILVDVRRGLEQEEDDLIEFLEQRAGLTIVIVATKVDKLSRSAQKPALSRLSAHQGKKLVVVATSAESGQGRDQLWSRILDACRVH